jgi:hypothetical protein
VSHYEDFLVGQSQADWLDDIPTNHKAMFTEFKVKSKAVEPVATVAVAVARDEDAANRLKVVSWDVAGSLDFHDPTDIDAALTFDDAAADSCPLAASIACLQNTGLPDEVYETTNYKWRNLPGSGTAILFRKDLLDHVRPINFKQITDGILEATFVWRQQRCRLVSAYIAEGGAAKAEYTQLIAHLMSVQDATVFTTVMGNLNAEVGRQGHENGTLLLGLLSLTQYRLMTSESGSKTVLATCRQPGGGLAQTDHVICSASDSLATNLTAAWVQAIRSDHKMLRLYVGLQEPRRAVAAVSPGLSAKRTYTPSPNDKLVVGSLNMSALCTSKAAVEEFDTIFEREPAPSDPFQVLCLQNTGLAKGTLVTRGYNWRTSGGGTSIVLSKELCALVKADLHFFEITDRILVCELLWSGQRLRLISFYAPCGTTAKLEFTELIAYLMDRRSDGYTTLLMGDFNAMIGRHDQYGQPDHDLTAYDNLPHDTSNENGVLLKGLLRLTQFRLESALSLSRTLQSTCETKGGATRLLQVDHVLVSPHSEFDTQVVMAKWLREIETNHKILITHIVQRPAGEGGVKRTCFGRV